ncbi:MAG: hypothetical protein IJE46_00220 [Clostridia bacterium]|nr:hypothetical protein [Clostridia bacterium]
MKKITVLLLLMITMISFIGCDSTNTQISLNRPIHSLQTINKKRATDKMVYTAKGSNQYHRSSCRHMYYTRAIKTSDAIKAGFTPCTVCKP